MTRNAAFEFTEVRLTLTEHDGDVAGWVMMMMRNDLMCT